MSDIAALGSRLPLDNVKRLTGLNLKPIKLPEELQARLKEIQEFRYSKPSGPPDEVYAEVKVGGKVVATLYNSGAAVTSNAAAGKLRQLPSMGEGTTLTGPALAQLRAEEIAKALGGTVSKAETAMTQSQWRNRPPTTWTVDHEAMARDQAAREASAAARQAAVRTLVDAQVIGNTESDTKA